MTITQSRRILSALGYEVSGSKNNYCVSRGIFAQQHNLPTGQKFDKDGMEAFCKHVINVFGCPALAHFA